MNAWLKQYRALFFIVLALCGWSAIFYFIPADLLVESIGIQHSYVVAFCITLLAGFSSFTGGTAYAAVIEFSRGGSDPLILGLVSGFGLFLSDSAFYLLILRGRASVEITFKTFFRKLQTLLDRLPSPAVYVIVYLFCAFGPIPNDIILAILVVSGYSYKRLWPVVLAGDITFMLFLSYVFQP